ncbi:MAG TPA: OmpA family protein [Myxococcota bacterium]|nr:OmpA family protein [Myxococcota bacterium]
MTNPIVQRESRARLAWIAGSALGVCLLALGCATPPTPQPLVDAQTVYKEAESDANVQKNASVELYEAKRALDRAQTEWNDKHDVDETEHLAMLASRRVEVAESWAVARASQAQAEVLRSQISTNAKAMATSAEQARADAEAARKAANEANAREAKLRTELSDLQARETARGLELTLGDILFGVDQADLKPGAMQSLYRLVTFLKQYPDRGVLVEGYTDSTGSDAYNMTLSQKRADSVQTFLVQNGVDAKRILARGYGKAYPVASNDTADGRQRNRRVGIVILHPGETPESKARPAA